MPAIRTVYGTIAPDALGPALMHEHLLSDFDRTTGQPDQLLNDEDPAVEELAALATAPGATP